MKAEFFKVILLMRCNANETKYCFEMPCVYQNSVGISIM